MLEERRTKLRIKLLQILSDTSIDAGMANEGEACSCAWAGRHHLAHTDVVRAAGLQPRQVFEMTVVQGVEKMGWMREPVVPQPWTQCGYRWHAQPEYGASRGRCLKHTLATEGGLCIDCVRSCDKGVKVECRKEHEAR
jgi:hypothetical protein